MKLGWWRNLLRMLWGLGRQSGIPRASDQVQPSRLDSHTLKSLIHMIFSTRDNELSCDECFEHVDRFAEMVLAGKDASEAMPLVQDHLERCSYCREEFEALLDALRVIATDPDDE